MTQVPIQTQARPAPQPTVYTLLLIVAILVLIVALGFVVYNLTSTSHYGLSIGQLFGAPAPVTSR